MKPQKWILAVVAALFLVSCSATSRRISANEDLFESYPPDVQATIKSGRINRGFDSTQVYMAFGNADRTELQEEQELWFYHLGHKRVVREEKTAAEYRLEMADYENATLKGQEGLTEPQTYRDVHLYRTGICRVVRFQNGRVIGWEEPEDMWLDDWHE